MAYDVILTVGGQEDYDRCIEYILYRFENPVAAGRLREDIEQTLDRLETMAEAFPICESEKLKHRNLRKVHLSHYDYKVFYHIENDSEVYVDAIIHDKQDFETILQ